MSPRDAGIEKEISKLERKLELIRTKQSAFEDWERSRRPIRIGFWIVIPIVLAVEGVHFYVTLGRTQGSRAPWLMILSAVGLTVVSIWYYRQAKTQRDNVLMGFSRAAETADRLEARIRELRTEAEKS